MLKIVSAKVIVTCPGRNFVTLKIETEGGLSGIGDATVNGRELAVASYLNDHLIPALIGRDAQAIEDIWQYFYKGAYWRRGPITMAAIGAVDTALWDIKAKQARLPLYQLLGGASRTGVMVYGHANGNTVEETIEEARLYQAMGYKAVRLQTGVPGLASTYGVSKDKLYYEPADAALPSENVWSTARYLPTVPKLFETAREAQGPGALSAVLAGRRHPGGEPGRLPPDPSAYDHAPGGGRSVQHGLGRKTAHRGAADRLYPQRRGPCRRDHPSSAHRRPG
jgi:mannonate dehydratase